MQGINEKLSSVLGPNKNKKIGVILVLLIAIPVAVGSFGHFQKKNNNPQVLAANEVNTILVKVGKLMDLPSETPTIATVSDVTKLTGQEFFAKAQNGDKVIIFPKAQKAVLYRPSTNKLIEVAFYNPPAVTPSLSLQPSPSSAPVKSLQEFIKGPTVQPSPQKTPIRSAVSTTPVVSPSRAPSPTPGI